MQNQAISGVSVNAVNAFAFVSFKCPSSHAYLFIVVTAVYDTSRMVTSKFIKHQMNFELDMILSISGYPCSPLLTKIKNESIF